MRPVCLGACIVFFPETEKVPSGPRALVGVVHLARKRGYVTPSKVQDLPGAGLLRVPASSTGRQGSCVRAGRRHDPLNAKCWSPQRSERAASSPSSQGPRAWASNRQGSPRSTLRPGNRASTPAPLGLPAPPPTAPCACAPPAASPPARMPCRRPPAHHSPPRIVAPSGPSAPYASASTASPRLCRHRASTRRRLRPTASPPARRACRRPHAPHLPHRCPPAPAPPAWPPAIVCHRM